MYGNNIINQSERPIRNRHPVGSRGCDAIGSEAPLGIFTKSQATFKNTGVERLHNFILQDQACKLLPKHRVCNCLKKRIDKTKDRLVKYNVDRKKAHWSNVQRCGCLWIDPVCAKQITEGRRSELSAALERW